MKKKDTYTAAQWDFINTWDIEEGESYPWLRGLPRPPEVGGTSTVSVTGVTLNKHELILTENGPSETLTVAIEPSDTTNKDVTWTSSDESVVSVSDGVVTPVGVGTAVITVKTKDGGYTDTCFVTVNPALKSIAVTPTAVNITEDKSQQLTVTAHYSDGSTKDITGEAEYTSSDTGITTVSVNGLVSGITPGSAAVTITYEGKSVTVPVTVNAAITLQSITVTPNPVVIDEGNTAALSVLANYSDGSTKDITDEAEYTSDNSAIATVNTSGLVTGITPGTTTVTVSYNSITSNINITVNEAYAPPVLENITVSPAVVNILTGKTQSLAVTAYYSDGSTKDVTGSASYQVANASIATVVGSTVQGVSIGSTTITVRYEGKTATVPITITEPRGDDTGSDTTVITKPRGDDTGSDTTVITKPRGDDTGSDITVITKPRGDDTGSNTTVITKPRGDDTGSNITVITKPRGDDTGSNITVITKPRGDDTGSNTTVITKPRGDDTGSNITVITKTR
nr:Ig-like domain-containing protein [Desulforadius tongensis]